jgi:hypothetical protein
VPSKILLTEPIFIPAFGMNKPGMQADIIAPPELQARWAQEWQDLADICRMNVEKWSNEGMHKQHANRPLEWFGWIDVLVTSTDWANFYALRISEYAQPEFDELARAMKLEMDNSKPKLLQPNEWHLPYITEEDEDIAGFYAMPFDNRYRAKIEYLWKLSTARCARLSYKPFDGNADYEAEVARYEKLVVSTPVHASPAEHQATPDRWDPMLDPGDHHADLGGWASPSQHGNFRGWIQHRKLIDGEAVND